MWTFKRTLPGYTRRAAFEGEFFKGESDEHDLNSRTDALVREVIQNSLDATDSAKVAPVRVRFTFSSKETRLNTEKNVEYLSGLTEHLESLGLDQINRTLALPMSYLLIEDFGTRGLCGEPERERDPEQNSTEDQSFFWFWRNVGRSGKSGTQRGRWGLGKSVFPSASKINAFFGLTVRSTDKRELLMGQAITRIHTLHDQEYVPEAYFHTQHDNTEIQMPFESPTAIITDFRKDFGVTRTDEPGLSVVIPYPLSIYKATDIVRSAIVHFFVPILRRQLIVEVHGGDVKSHVIERTTIRSIADQLDWSSKTGDKHHTRPPFDFAEWALSTQVDGNLAALRITGHDKAPQWSPDLFAEDQIEALQEALASNSRVALRVPLALEMKDGSFEKTYFDAFLEKDTEISHGEDHFVREGMTISKVATLRSQKGARGLVLVDDRLLSSFLGDAEGPAHTEWSENEDRPDINYKKWKSRLRFVKNSLKRLIDILSPVPEGLDTDLLQEIFSIADNAKPRQRKKKKKPGEETPDPPEIPPPTPPVLHVDKLEGNHGFRVKAGSKFNGNELRVAIRAAYAVPKGNPFSNANYSAFDFVFDTGKKESIRVTHTENVKITDRRLHLLAFQAKGGDFSVEATGFDPVRDLVVEATLLED